MRTALAVSLAMALMSCRCDAPRPKKPDPDAPSFFALTIVDAPFFVDPLEGNR